MSVQVSTNNSSVPFIRSGQSFTRDSETLLQDAGRSTDLANLTLMARNAVTVPTTGTAGGSNVGDGTVTGVALAAGEIPRDGTWELECTVETVNGGTFKLTDPGGNIVANDLVMTAGAGAATTFFVPSAGLTFIITDGTEDFDTGDVFTVAITANGKWVPFDEDAITGAQIPRGILLTGSITAAALVAGDVVDQAILTGGTCTIDASQLVIEGTATVNTVLSGGQTISDTLAAIGIFLEDTVDITEFENA